MEGVFRQRDPARDLAEQVSPETSEEAPRERVDLDESSSERLGLITPFPGEDAGLPEDQSEQQGDPSAINDEREAVTTERPDDVSPTEGPDVEHLLAAANAPDREGYTVAGRSLTKHAVGQRTRSGAFPSLSGDASSLNETAADHVREIVSDPDSERVIGRTRSGETTIKYFAPDGRGVTFSAAGAFLYFGERRPR